jgi:hypothetical protein
VVLAEVEVLLLLLLELPQPASSAAPVTSISGMARSVRLLLGPTTARVPQRVILDMA